MNQSASHISSNLNLRGFKHRTLVGWISEFSSRPLHEPWPVIKLDDKMMSDFCEIIDGGLFPGEQGDRETYLLRMSADNLNGYEREIQVALSQLEQIKAGVGRLSKCEHVRRSLNAVLSDIKGIRADLGETR